MKIHLIFITHNRIIYTKKAIDALLADPFEKFTLTIWDNGSNDGTEKFLKSLKDPRITEIIYSEQNRGQIDAVNAVWTNSDADLLGKCDNDVLVTPGWTNILRKAHKDIENLGVVACWHFFQEDFIQEKALHKIQEFSGHKILRHPWTCGTGVLIKNDHFKKFGPLKGNTTTSYWMKLAKSGLINGFYIPLVFQEHMDDPKSRYSILKDDRSLQEAKKFTVSLNSFNQNTIEERLAGRQKIINNLLCGPWEVKYYTGYRKILQKVKRYMIGGKIFKFSNDL